MDCILCTMPIMREVDRPLIAPYSLKSYLTERGFSAKVLNLNEKLCNFLGLENVEASLPKFSYRDQFNSIYKDIEPFIKDCASEILGYSPKVVGLSLMSFQSYMLTEKLCEQLKEMDESVEIVVGGPGIFLYGQTLYDKGLVNAYVIGDGESPLVEILKGNYDYVGINGKGRNVEDLDSLPFVDYSDANNKKKL